MKIVHLINEASVEGDIVTCIKLAISADKRFSVDSRMFIIKKVSNKDAKFRPIKR